MLVILTPFFPSHPPKLSQSPNVYCVLCTARKIKTKNVIRNQDKTDSARSFDKMKITQILKMYLQTRKLQTIKNIFYWIIFLFTKKMVFSTIM